MISCHSALRWVCLQKITLFFFFSFKTFEQSLLDRSSLRTHSYSYYSLIFLILPHIITNHSYSYYFLIFSLRTHFLIAHTFLITHSYSYYYTRVLAHIFVLHDHRRCSPRRCSLLYYNVVLYYITTLCHDVVLPCSMVIKKRMSDSYFYYYKNV